MIAAAMIGISFANTWVCILVSFGCSAESERNGLQFITGRFLGLMILGVSISAVSFVADFPPIVFVGVFATLSVAFGLLVLSRTLGFGSRLRAWPARATSNHKIEKKFHAHPSRRRKFVATNGGSCGKHSHAHKSDGENKRGQVENHKGVQGFNAFFLGVFRGATPCLKIMILAPLLISADIWFALVIIAVYATASTMYPLIGFLFGNLLGKFERYDVMIRLAAAFILVSIGVYSIVNELLLAGHGRGI